MNQPANTSTRKKFLWWGTAALAAIGASRFFPSRKKGPKTTEKVKMLTQDGRLVEIEKDLLASGGKKITTDELKQWVNKKTPQQ